MQGITKETDLLVCYFDASSNKKLQLSRVRGFLHLYNDQEPVLTGAPHAMDLFRDKIITAYRNYVQSIGIGVGPRYFLAELYRKATGTSQGLEVQYIFYLKSMNLKVGI